jgi:hypothetical protein
MACFLAVTGHHSNFQRTIMLLGIVVSVQAAEYSYKVYCKGSSPIYVDVEAENKEEAAARVDRMPDQVCKDDGKGNKTDATMRPDQCSRK